MAEFKKRFAFSMEKALADEASLPNRFTTSKGCGFVFIPLQRERLVDRENLLMSFTALNKYDQKLNKCVGLTFIAEGKGDWCDVQWCPLVFTWKKDDVLQQSSGLTVWSSLMVSTGSRAIGMGGKPHRSATLMILVSQIRNEVCSRQILE